MGERVKVDIGSLSEEITSINNCLEKRAAGAMVSIMALQRYCDEGQLKGAAYSNSKEFYQNTYIPLLRQVVQICGEIKAKNKAIPAVFSMYVPNTMGFDADTEVIEEEIRRLEQENANYQDRIRTAKANIDLGSRSIITWYNGRIMINNVVIIALKNIVNSMRAFNNNCANIYDGIEQSLQSLSNVIAKMGSASTWGNNRYMIPDVVLNWMTDIEYAKMVIHNADGTISLNREYVTSVLQQEEITGTSTEIMATYSALIKTFENISTPEDMEFFLNACYIKREISVSKPSNYSGKPLTPMDSYSYFNRQAQAQTENYFEYSLSPVFKEMMRYYSINIAPKALNDLTTLPYYNSPEAEPYVRKLTRAGILLNMVEYGDKTYSWKTGQTPPHPISVKWNDGVVEMEIGSSGLPDTGHTIVQYEFKSSGGIEKVGTDVLERYIQSLQSSWFAFGTEEATVYGVDKIIDSIGLAVPQYAIAIKGSAAIVKFMGSVADAIERNKTSQDALDASKFTKYMAAFGVEGQVCTVNGELKYQFTHLDKDVFLENFAAYNCYREEEPKYERKISVNELCNSSENVEDFLKFCNRGDEKGDISRIKNKVGDSLVTEYTTEEDRKDLELTIDNYVVGVSEP